MVQLSLRPLQPSRVSPIPNKFLFSTWVCASVKWVLATGWNSVGIGQEFSFQSKI